MNGKILLVDVDGTVSEDISNENSHLYENAKVLKGSLETLNKWHDEGASITFFTAREEKDRKVTINWLNNNGFKYHGLIMGKPRIKENQEYIWIDNRKVRAITYSGKWGLLKKTIKEILTF